MRRTLEKIRRRIPKRSGSADDLSTYAPLESSSSAPDYPPFQNAVHQFPYGFPPEQRAGHQRTKSTPALKQPNTYYRTKELPDIPSALPPLPSTFFDLPFPNEIFYLIIDKYLCDDTVSLLRLSRALPNFHHQCWEHAFKTVPVSIREREIRRKKLTSNVDLFLQLITSNPEILRYIRGLDITDHGRNTYQHLLGPTSAQDIATLAMLLVQSQHMPNLRLFRIRCWVHWPNFSRQLQSAFITLLESPSLEDISLANVALPVNLLALAPRLRTVDFQSGGVGAPVIYPGVPVAPAKTIQTLKVRDRDKFGQAMTTLGFVDTRSRPFAFFPLSHLEICLPGNQLSAIQPGISLCQSLECLKIFVGTAGGLPQRLDLGSQTSLKHLTISADVTSLAESEHRFFWLTTTLNTLPNQAVIEEVTIVMRIDSLQRGMDCDWPALDNVFSQHPERWAALKSVSIVWCTGRQKDLQENLNQEFMDQLPADMPILSGKDVLRVQTTYSDVSYNFWTFS